MSSGTTPAAVAAIIAVSVLALSSAVAEAAVCRARMSGEGKGLGIAGQGSAQARINALDDWSRKVRARDGARFADTSKAASVRYDCRQGAILEAKCVVTALPCADAPPKARKKKRR